jgi:hypothetical protein
MFTKIEREREMPVTQEELDRHAIKRELAQNVWPQLSPSDREWLMTGVTAEEWDQVFHTGSEA